MLLRGIPIPAGQTGHAAGRSLLAQLYREYTGEEKLPPIRIGERGKPCFEDNKVFFSVSHTHRYVFCAVASVNIGLDAEELDRQVSPRLAEKILSQTEYVQYQQAEDQNRALLTFWVLKEAAGKCTGEGINGYPNHTAFSLEDPRVTEQNGCLLAVVREDDHAL